MRSKEFLKTCILLFLLLTMLLFSVQLLVFRNLPVEARGDFETSLRTVLRSLGFDELAEMLPKQVGSLDPYDYSSRFAFPSSLTYNAEDAPVSTAYQMSSTLESYTELKPVLEAVLETVPEETDEDAWNALCGEQGSVVVDFGRPLSLRLFLQVAGKNDQNVPADARFRYLVLREQNGGSEALVQLVDGRYLRFRSEAVYASGFSSYFRTLRTGGGAQPVSLIGRADSLPGRTVSERYERGGALERQLVFPAEEGIAPELCFATNPIYVEGRFQEQSLENLLVALSFNPGSISRRTTQEGDQVYIENRSSVRVTPGGEISFQVSEDTAGLAISDLVGGTSPEKYSVCDVLYAAQSLFSSIEQELVGGEAVLRFEEAYYDPEQQALVVGFDYVLEGVRVRLTDGEGGTVRAATLTYRNGYFVEGEIHARNYVRTGPDTKRMNVLQMAQALALKGEAYSRMEILYLDPIEEGSAELTPEYYSVGEED